MLLKTTLLSLLLVAVYVEAFTWWTINGENSSVEKMSIDVYRGSGILFYSNCKGPRAVSGKNVSDCRVFRSNYEGYRTSKECSLRNLKVQGVMKNHPFKALDDSTVLISFGLDLGIKNTNVEASGFTVQILNMFDCQNKKEVSIPEARRGQLVVDDLAPGTFGVIYQTCQTCEVGEDNHLIIYNAKGEKIRGPERYTVKGLQDASYTHPVLLRSPKEAFYVRQATPAKDIVYKVNQNGEASKLIESSYDRVSVSSAQGVLGACWREQEITCRQYDSEGKVKLDSIVKIYSAEKKLWLNAFNLPENKMMLLVGFEKPDKPKTPETTEKPEPNGKNKTESPNKQIKEEKAILIGQDGRQSAPVRFNDDPIECANSTMPDFTHVKTNLVEKADEYCFRFSCAKVHREDNRPDVTKIWGRFSCIPKSSFELS